MMNQITTKDMAEPLPQLIERLKNGEPFSLIEENQKIAHIIPTRPSLEERKNAIERLRAFQEKNQVTLGGLSMKEMIEEGRR